ncbi:hypothetical protein FD13_GL001024 [Levilactobacillus senmaizukei DSM 21775 = NBRC 103853]|uniref:IrrE N-terminal-like domain-containing protein n=1 Tax=Levilactobacillus senmaizukei DSM 21775 = NBRC 103853 TaxID=1423803 RepID=A0A0R2DC52_9LACO|nr:ImmA/IrrE family metallo-endopeptidase [Levilactobacillus senmaizukei]KRN01433.1 hypothetical protein FD13_GL001024 [Levilactobacillus senmaizukei DSM 21775 = NBRC 103853]
MNNPVLFELEEKAARDGIDVIWTDGLGQTTPPTASVKRHRIIMNLHWIRPDELAFQLGHEMAHIYHDDPDDRLLYYSNRSTKSEIENHAHAGAIDLILPYYMKDRPQAMANPVDFMESFDVPGYLSEIVAEKIAVYCEENEIGIK